MPSLRDDPEFIGVDWGSSRLRIHLLAPNGTALETIELESGILKTDREAQRWILLDALRPWTSMQPGIPIYAAGMIGSRSGLVETEPLATPVDVASLAAAVLPLELEKGTMLNVLPGLVDNGSGHSDLIRGEEVQVFGWLDREDEHDSSLLVLPGTHSKWVRVVGQRITSFRTFPTGEMFATLLEMSSLAQATTEHGRPSSSDERDVSFQEGVAGGSRMEGFLHDVFAIRTKLLAGESSHPLVLDEYLSGMLIGYEIAEAASRGFLLPGEPVVLASEGELMRRYGIALEMNALTVIDGGRSNFIHGILAVHRHRAAAARAH